MKLIKVLFQFVCPAWFYRIQSYKQTIHGPWDEAVLHWQSLRTDCLSKDRLFISGLIVCQRTDCLSKDRLFVSGQIDFQAISFDRSTMTYFNAIKRQYMDHGMKMYYTDRIFAKRQTVFLKTDCLSQDRLIFKQYHWTFPHIT